MNLRSLLYSLARLLGDVNAVKRGRIAKRIGYRVTGRAFFNFIRKILK